jgi:hypothetical protein
MHHPHPLQELSITNRVVSKTRIEKVVKRERLT